MRGPANLPKDGATSLEGVIETDWASQPAYHSWKLTRVDHPVTWEDGEPICMVLPQRRGELEEWQPRLEDISVDEEVEDEYLLLRPVARTSTRPASGMTGRSTTSSEAHPAQRKRRPALIRRRSICDLSAMTCLRG